MKKKLIWISSLLIATGVLIAQVPNKFNAGDKLNATKLNDNFTYLTKLVKDGAGNVLGELIGATSTEVHIMNNKGYRFGIDGGGNVLVSAGITTNPSNATCATDTPFCTYIDSNCTMPAPSNTIYFNGSPGVVALMAGTSTLYYVDKTTALAPITLYTIPSAMSCTSASILKGYVAAPNNATITGVSASSFALPIAIVNQ